MIRHPISRISFTGSLLVLVLAITSIPATAQQRLDVRVDPRIELLGVVQLLAGGIPTATALHFPYRERVEAHFGRFGDHPAVAMLRRLAKHGFVFDAPVIALLNCSDPPELALRHTPAADGVQRGGGLDSLEAWLQVLRQFVTETGFAAFLDSNAAYYAELERSVTSQLEPDLVQRLEQYYGMRQDGGYAIVLSPLTQGGFGPRIEVAPGTFRLFSVASPSEYTADTLRFFTAAGLRTLVWHEFAHSFVNPLTEQYWSQLEPAAGLLDSIAERLPAWYRQWKPALDEHIVRAVTARMVAKYRGGEEGKKAIEREVGWGFVYVPAIDSVLEEYERDRTRWPDFASFFPRIVTRISSLATPH